MNSSPSLLPKARRVLATTAALGVMTATAGLIQPVTASAAPRVPTSNVPSALSTSPTSSCKGASILGDGDITLYAAASGANGGTVIVDFKVSRHDNHRVVDETNPRPLTVPSGTTAAYHIPGTTWEAAADGEITEFDWKVRTTVSGHTSAWSTTCHFSFDPTRPGMPSIAQPGSTTIGQPISLSIAAPNGGSSLGGYQYQLNEAGPVNVAPNASGGATITITPTRSVNTLSVTSMSPGGNLGGSTRINFVSAAPPTDFTDGDLTGDGMPDLVTIGAQNGLPSGLWLATGGGNGYVGTSPIDIGINGNGFNTAGSPSDFDRATAITGRFTAGPNQDVLIYYPDAGDGEILQGNGTGTPLVPGGEPTLSSGSLANFDGDNPTQIVNAGDTSGSDSGIPDLIGILGDRTSGYGLNLYTSFVPGGYGFPVTLNVNTPDGTADWDNWTIASTQLPISGGTSTAMFLWNKASGELDLWENLAADPETGDLTYRAYPVATGWNTNSDVALQAADINNDGTPDLWAVGAGETVTADLFSNLSATGPASLTPVNETLNADN